MTAPNVARRVAVALATATLAFAAILGAVAPASAGTGTGGIDLTVLPPSGGTALSFSIKADRSGQTSEAFLLRNLSRRARTVHIYGGAAYQNAQGAYSFGPPGSAPWLQLANQRFTMAPHSRRQMSLVIDGSKLPANGTQALGAVFLEVPQGAIIPRDAVLVHVTMSSSSFAGIPIAVAVIAGLLIVGVIGALVVVRRRRADEPAAAGSPNQTVPQA